MGTWWGQDGDRNEDGNVDGDGDGDEDGDADGDGDEDGDVDGDGEQGIRIETGMETGIKTRTVNRNDADSATLARLFLARRRPSLLRNDVKEHDIPRVSIQQNHRKYVAVALCAAVC